MAIKPIVALPKGNAGMTLISSRNDDSTVSFPDLGFDFKYNGSPVRIIYSNGNTWIGFGTASEHLTINRKDTSVNNLYYKYEVENQTKLFRIRFEGNSYYGSWGSNDLIWEISLYETGVFTLIIENMPNNGTNNFINPGIGTQPLTLEVGKSYVFEPGDSDGKKFSIVEGSYFPHIDKFLIVDDEGVKTLQLVEEVSTWVKVADLPVTQELLLEYGCDALPATLDGLIGDAPTVYYYTDNQDAIEAKENYEFEILMTATSLPKVIIQREDFLIHTSKVINKIELDISLDKRDSIGNLISTDSEVRLAISVDEGLTWLTFNMENSLFEEIDINNIAEFLSNGMNPQNLSTIDYSALNQLIETNRKIRFAYLLEKPTFDDVCKLKKLKIFYS